LTVAITATRQAAIKAGHDLLALVQQARTLNVPRRPLLERLSADSAQDRGQLQHRAATPVVGNDNPVAAETVKTVSWSLLVCVGVALAAR
jgi:hypothetical protein